MRYVLPALFLLAGCTTSRTVEMVSTAERNRINERAGHQTTFVTLHGDQERFVRSLHVAADSVTWLDARTGEARSAPRKEVEAVRLLRRGAGTQRGAVVGGGIGLLVGLLMTAAEGDAPRGLGRPYFGPALWVPLGVLPGAAIGGVAASDRSTEYRLSRASVDTRYESAALVVAPESCDGPPLACAISPRATGR